MPATGGRQRSFQDSFFRGHPTGQSFIRIVATLSCTTLLGIGHPASGEGEVRIFADPPVVRVTPGSSVFVAVGVEGVPTTGLAAFQVELAYDQRRVEVRDPNAEFTSQGIAAFAPLGNSPFCALVRRTGLCPDAPWFLTSTGRQALGTSAVDALQGRVTIAYATYGETSPTMGQGTLAVLQLLGKRAGPVRLRPIDAVLADASDPPKVYSWVIGRPPRR